MAVIGAICAALLFQLWKLVEFIRKHSGTIKVRRNQKMVVTLDWLTPEGRLNGAKALLGQLAKLAG